MQRGRGAFEQARIPPAGEAISTSFFRPANVRMMKARSGWGEHLVVWTREDEMSAGTAQVLITQYSPIPACQSSAPSSFDWHGHSRFQNRANLRRRNDRCPLP